MKKTITQLAVLLTICLFTISCDGGKDDIPTVKGKWKVYERTVRTTDTRLDKSINYALEEDLKEKDITRTFTELNVTTTARKKDTEGNSGLISEITESYNIKGDSLHIDDVINGGTRIAKYLITERVLTTYMKITSQDLINMAPEIGIDPHLIPEGVTGELKMKEIR